MKCRYLPVSRRKGIVLAISIRPREKFTNNERGTGTIYFRKGNDIWTARQNGYPEQLCSSKWFTDITKTHKVYVI